MTEGNSDTNSVDRQRLLSGVAGQLKQPLLYIARRSELANLSNEQSTNALRDIEAHAAMALQLVDSYLLGISLESQASLALNLEPVSLSALLADVAHEISPLARQYNVTIEIDSRAQNPLVFGHSQALHASIQSLALALVGLPADKKHHRLRLSAKAQGDTILTGVYHDALADLPQSRNILSQSKRGQWRQPLREIASSQAAGIYVAQQLFDALGSELQLRRQGGMQGFAGPLVRSTQLSLL